LERASGLGPTEARPRPQRYPTVGKTPSGTHHAADLVNDFKPSTGCMNARKGEKKGGGKKERRKRKKKKRMKKGKRKKIFIFFFFFFFFFLL